MKQFDYRKFLKENKSTFHSSLNEDASSTARKFAQHMSKKEGKKFTVTPGSVDEKSFDLDLDGEEYMGGSYLVKDNGDIVNVAMGNKVAGNINQLDENDLTKNIGLGLDYEATEEMIRDYADRLLGAGVDDVEDLANFYLDNPEDLPEPLEYEFFKNNFDDILSVAMTGEDDITDRDRAAWGQDEYGDELYDLENHDDEYGLGDEDELDEGKAAYKYEKGKKAGEEIEKKKIKKSELKAKIKEMILAEQDEETEEEVDAEATDEVTPEETETTVDVATDEVNPDVKAVQDALTQAQAAAQKLGDPKLTDQIGNTITFFTRAHVVEKPKGAVAESLFPLLKKILK